MSLGRVGRDISRQGKTGRYRLTIESARASRSCYGSSFAAARSHTDGTAKPSKNYTTAGNSPAPIPATPVTPAPQKGLSYIDAEVILSGRDPTKCRVYAFVSKQTQSLVFRILPYNGTVLPQVFDSVKIKKGSNVYRVSGEELGRRIKTLPLSYRQGEYIANPRDEGNFDGRLIYNKWDGRLAAITYEQFANPESASNKPLSFEN